MFKKPNIILINCDDLGYGDLGCYGSELNKTPVLDSMAVHGIRFNDFYMASPLCSPSRGAMMTGCYPPRIGFGDFDGCRVLFPGQGVGLNPNEKTIASILKDAGYKTMLIGKWHCGDQKEFLPARHGFDSYYGLPYSNDMGRQAGRENMPPLPLILDEEVLQEQPDQSSLTERYTEQAVRFIRNNKDHSFFLYLAHMHVHLPLYAPDRFIKQSRNGTYGAAVECIDWSAGVILDELVRQGLDKNTLLIFTSDNGSRGDHGGSNAPLRGTKGTTWEGGMRVPCIMYWPGVISEGIVYDDIVSSIDFYPTLAKLAQVKIPGDRIIDGYDISPLIFEGKTSPRTTFFYYLGDSIEAVRHGKWKLHIRKERNKIRKLYNLDEDIGETNNIIECFPVIAAGLEKLIEDCRDDIGDAALGKKGKNIRPSGKIDNPVTLTRYNPSHPYIEAMYDSKDFG
ncbi:MAG: sulfatase family protein [Eubacteriales bacterium]